MPKRDPESGEHGLLAVSGGAVANQRGIGYQPVAAADSDAVHAARGGFRPMALQIEQSAGACSSHQDLRAGHRQRWKTIYFCFVIVAVCLSFAAAFQIGVDRGFRDSLGKESYGRILFAVGAAITRAHGGYGYSFSSVIETILSFGGLTGDATILKDLGMKFPDNLSNTTLVNAAIDKALTFKWPFDPDKDVRGSAGDDLGIVDYVRLGFLLFGYKVQSLYYVYFVILGAAVAAFLYAFRDRPSMLALLAIACAAQVFLFTSSLFDSINAISAAEPSSIAIADPRFLSSLAIIPGLHLGSLMLT